MAKKRKRISEILHQVDPNLKVVEGGVRRRTKRSMAISDWEKVGGVFCSRCNSETLRLIDGLCPQCQHALEMRKEEEEGKQREKRALIMAFNQGRINLRQLKEGRFH